MSDWWRLVLFPQGVQAFCEYGLKKSIRQFEDVASLGSEIPGSNLFILNG